MSDTTISISLEICGEGVVALRALSTILTQVIWRQDTDCLSPNEANGLMYLFRDELDSIEDALGLLRDTLDASDIPGRSPFNETFGDAVVPGNRKGRRASSAPE